MSDFDREAERERLREKYERDEEKRKHSERMSELLLKGATMTNVHCDECGDPIFRYDGQEFCPTCQREVGADAADAAPAGGAAPGQGPDAPDESGSAPAVDAGSDVVADGIVGDADADADPAATPDRPATPGDETPDPGASPEGSAGNGGSAPSDAGRAAAAPPTSPDRGAASPGRPAAGDTGDGDLAEARAALVRTLADAARRAEETTDPRTRRDHLAAAREAAEALSVLR